MSDSRQHLVNPDSQAMAYAAVARLQEKVGFVPGGSSIMDPSGGGGGGGGPGGSPPGGPPPGNGDPGAGAAGPPPMDAGMAGGSAPPPVAPPMNPAMQPVEPIKPKIDVNVTMLQILKLLARISDALGIPVPASEMVATQGDLTQMGMQQSQGGGAAGAGQQSAIPPIAPVQPAAPGMGGGKSGSDKMASVNNGTGFDTAGLDSLSNRAAAIARIRSARAA